MALTNKEIEIFADFAADRFDDRKNATAYYLSAINDLQANGFRATKRVKDILWKRLLDLQEAD